MTQRLHVMIEGSVQGVGFRFSTQRKADSLGLAGWVRNLYDGRVEAEFEGPEYLLAEILDWCRQGSRFATVTHVESRWESGESRYEDFRIRA